MVNIVNNNNTKDVHVRIYSDVYKELNECRNEFINSYDGKLSKHDRNLSMNKLINICCIEFLQNEDMYSKIAETNKNIRISKSTW